MRYLRVLPAWILFGNVYAIPNQSSTSDGSPSVSTFATVTSFERKPSPNPTSASLEPCGIVSSEINRLASAGHPAPTPVIGAEIAYQCLKSVPIVKSDALRLIGGLAPYFNFQSTVGFLKNPPRGYLLPGVDLLNGLAKIEEKVRNDIYSNEYDFETEILELVTSVHDGHFGYFPDAISQVFQFGTGLSAVSISKDGREIPQIFVSSDIAAHGKSTIPSRVVSINGQDPTTYLQTWSARNSVEQDPDALYNKLFSGIARNNDASSANTFSKFTVYPGPFTILKFENGTTIKQRNIATVIQNFKGVNSGQSFYSKFCRVSDSTTADSTPTSKSTLPPPSSYPSPLVRHPLNLVAGYTLKTSKTQDVAVLAIPSFDSEGEDPKVFQKVVETFFAKAKALGKTKLIIDLQSNPGGTVFLGVDLLGQLFPHIVPYNAANLRATPDIDLLGQGISNLVEKEFVPETDPTKYNISSPINQVATLPLNFRHDIKPDGLTAYKSWPEFFGPDITSHDNLTFVFRENLTDPLFVVEEELIITGTLNRTGFAQPFAVEDIVLLYDGICASTCAVFSELMKTQAGVRSIAVGGRPQYSPMQGVGGTKGARVYKYDTILQARALAYDGGSKEYQAKVNQTGSNFTEYPLQRALGNSFNVFNNIRLGDDSITPLQFVYEAAGCRLFYTWDMLSDITALWDRVADVAFGSPDFSSPYCVKGSTGHPSAAPNITDYNSYEPPPGARCQHCGSGPTDGGNSTIGGGSGVPQPSNSTVPYYSSLASPIMRGFSPALVLAFCVSGVFLGI